MSLLEVRVQGLILEPKTQQNIVILRELDGERILPIWIGPGEAQAIRRILAEESFPRPLTHDLLYLVIEGLKARVARVVISELRENTFFASVIIERDGQQMLSIDSRPSDSVALALRARAPIFANEALLQPPPRETPEAERQEEEEEEESDEPKRELTEEEKAEQLRRFLEKLNPEDFGKFQL